MISPVDARLFNAALARRKSLIESGATTAYRILNGAPDGLDGVVMERFGPVLIVQWHEGRADVSPGRVQTFAQAAHDALGTTGVYLKRFVKDRAAAGTDIDARHRDATPWIGQPVPPEITIEEHGLRFLIRPYDGFSVGLFLEHRDNRRLIRELAAGRRVLNLFAYTCGFGVAAACGGASLVANVDLSRRYLEWGRDNFALNGIETRATSEAAAPESEAGLITRFYASDTFDFFARAARQGLAYDLIVLDPPTFSRTRRPARVFELDADLHRLLAGAISLLAPGGHLFFATNYRQMSMKRIEAQLHAAAEARDAPRPPRRVKILKRPALPADFAGDADYSKSILVRID
ncbi:MAG: hypothetical protein HBSAPP02_21810 [Phycisphaerae bacterium]|nr:MAG: class I SAM-dependent rRNA methyltransferase [Planctomycetia bacterium]RIK70808.1 MAG: hypothetical protein DCC66_04005 [Planctomycetota bacterium]GJQ27149.1 MAG: hypothetical protein HBSAPP02_21810 [Phycisphaerae bacterium]